MSTKTQTDTATYWHRRGKHQALYDDLMHLIPRVGHAATMHGELLRCAMNVYHDLYNNGLCNADMWHMHYQWGNLDNWSDEIEAKMGDRADDLRLVLAFVKRHQRAMERGRSPYVDNDFPYAPFERVMDAVILVVAELDAPASSPGVGAPAGEENEQ